MFSGSYYLIVVYNINPCLRLTKISLFQSLEVELTNIFTDKSYNCFDNKVRTSSLLQVERQQLVNNCWVYLQYNYPIQSHLDFYSTYCLNLMVNKRYFTHPFGCKSVNLWQFLGCLKSWPLFPDRLPKRKLVFKCVICY